jgi:hypothetical protein
MDNENHKIIYVYLLNEPVDAWRPVHADEIGQGIYHIGLDNDAPDDEEWEFSAGEYVLVREVRFSDDRIELVAVEKVDSVF